MTSLLYAHVSSPAHVPAASVPRLATDHGEIRTLCIIQYVSQ